MPKQTFYNLASFKQEKIINVLKDIFKTKHLFQTSVKEIVDKLEIPRGSFYQYFENLEDAYFMILDLEIIDIHKLFLAILKENNYEIFKSLEIYGIKLSEILFKEQTYQLYMNRYLNWTYNLEQAWKKYQTKNQDLSSLNYQKIDKTSALYSEKMQFIKAVIHDLIQRIYLNKWDVNQFLRNYNKHLDWLKGGLNND